MIGILHTIFFHRLFTPVSPSTHDVLDTTLPYVTEDDIERTIDARATSLLRALDTTSTPMSPQYHASKPAHGTVVVQFLEKKRKKGGWFIAKADEEAVWEVWILNVTVSGARSEPDGSWLARDGDEGAGGCQYRSLLYSSHHDERGEPISVPGAGQSQRRWLEPEDGHLLRSAMEYS
jgi:hypothetical protein